MSDVITPNDGIDVDIHEVLDDEDTIGIGEVEPGSETVVYEDARSKFHTAGRKRRGGYEIGDEESNIFISSDGGKLTLSFGPEFAPIETCIKQGHITKAQAALGKTIYESFDLLFDDTGLVAFRGEEVTVIVAPIQWEWDRPHAQTAPCGPRGPSI